VAAPLMAVIAYRIRRADGGKAFFAHSRVGRHGELFRCYKFRTMISTSSEVLARLLAEDPEARAEWERDHKLRNDPRITPVGRFLRRTSLDELPQLLNVLRGEMSLVGPRPVVMDELDRYGEARIYYLQVRPGLTGLWQISGRNDVDYGRRVSLDTWYVRNWTLWYDLVILFKTALVVPSRGGAY
jgi:undecaprenyl-phosphate galactose phosphotransferase